MLYFVSLELINPATDRFVSQRQDLEGSLLYCARFQRVLLIPRQIASIDRLFNRHKHTHNG